MKYLTSALFFYLPDPYLNPIEDLWRMIKDRIYETYYDTLDELITIFKEGFDKFVGLKSLYENDMV